MFFTFPLQIPTSGNFFFVALGIQEAFRRAVDPEHKPYWEVPMTPSWRATGWGVFAIATLGILFLNYYTYNALYAEVRNKEARVYKQYQRWNEAYALLTDSIEHYPYMEGYYYDRAVVLMQMGRKHEALKDLQETARLVPNYAMGRKQIGFLARELGIPELAVEEFRKTMQIYRTMREELTGLIAETALAYNKPDLAIPTLKETIEMGITHPTFIQSLADAYLLKGSYPDAISQYQKLRELGTWNPDVRVRYAYALSMAGDITQAEKEVRAILVAHEDHAESWFVLGRLDLMKGKTQEALGAFTKAIALDPKVRTRMLLDPLIKTNKEILEWLKQS
jgi:tetratricopeptide (TPR) repeat protein